MSPEAGQGVPSHAVLLAPDAAGGAQAVAALAAGLSSLKVARVPSTPIVGDPPVAAGFVDRTLGRWLHSSLAPADGERVTESTVRLPSPDAPGFVEELRRLEPQVLIAFGNDAPYVGAAKALGARLYTLFDGISPRYDGLGNLAAFSEDNFATAGFTVFERDAGGERKPLLVSRLDFIGKQIPFGRSTSYSLEAAAEALVHYLRGAPPSNEPDLGHLRAARYGSLALSDLWRARSNYARRLAGTSRSEQDWKKSFEEVGKDTKVSSLQRLFWQDESTVAPRDAMIGELYARHAPKDGRILDVGCGDARLSKMLPARSYVGCDYTREFPGRASSVIVNASADALPFPDASFECTLAIGLLASCAETSQPIVDELLRVTAPGGCLIINTVRQFSVPELLCILAGSVHQPVRFKLAWAALMRDYYRGARIGGTPVGKRYSLAELKRHLRADDADIEVRYGGVGGTALFSRETTVVVRKRAKA